MKKTNLDKITVFRVGGEPYTREDLMKMDPVCLRALFRERVHHTIEVEIYPVLLGRKKMPKDFGLQTELILDVWKARGYSDEDEDFQWGKKYMELAGKMRAGEKIEIEEALPTPFTAEEMAVVHKLIWERRSVRDWVADKPVPEEMITKILEAGRAAHRLQPGYCPFHCYQGYGNGQDGLERYPNSDELLCSDCYLL